MDINVLADVVGKLQGVAEALRLQGQVIAIPPKAGSVGTFQFALQAGRDTVGLGASEEEADEELRCLAGAL